MIAVACTAAALPFGDASDGTNFLFGPVAAGTLTWAIAWLRLRGPWRMSQTFAMAAFAAVLTFTLMVVAVLVVIALFGI
ncbi:MAG: hypothetical protein ACXVFC_08385 [Gaiellaceae bacterium]